MRKLFILLLLLTDLSVVNMEAQTFPHSYMVDVQSLSRRNIISTSGVRHGLSRDYIVFTELPTKPYFHWFKNEGDGFKVGFRTDVPTDYDYDGFSLWLVIKLQESKTAFPMINLMDGSIYPNIKAKISGYNVYFAIGEPNKGTLDYCPWKYYLYDVKLHKLLSITSRFYHSIEVKEEIVQ